MVSQRPPAPADMPCPSCGRTYPHEWREGFGPFRSQWVRPSFQTPFLDAPDLRVCEVCAPTARLEHARDRLQRELQRMGMPERLRKQCRPTLVVEVSKPHSYASVERVAEYLLEHGEAQVGREGRVLQLTGKGGRMYLGEAERDLPALAKVEGHRITLDSLQQLPGYGWTSDADVRATARRRGCWGVVQRQRQAWRLAFQWARRLKGDPRADDTGEPMGRGLLLHGPVGTGKSALAALLCAHFSKVEPPVLEELGRDARHNGRPVFTSDEHYRRAVYAKRHLAYRRAPVVPWRWYDEGELLRRHELKWTRDKDPLGRALDVEGVLVLDDLGRLSSFVDAEAGGYRQPHGRTETKRVENVERLVTAAYDRGRRLLMTTNIHPRDYAQVWGARVADRLREMCTLVELAGASWRQNG